MVLRIALRTLLAALAAVAVISAAPPAVAGSKVAAAEGSNFLRMDPLIVPIIRNGTVERHLGFVFLLELADKKFDVKVRELMPRLTNAFVSDLNALATAPRAAESGIDAATLKRRLIASCQRILGPDIVRDVLVDRSFVRSVS
ncbi:MAG: hypothetical protein HY246_14575 [Proteobacteria bacterium]|nr:hypothetical protein [Pseudomonadota bacterium]